MLVLPRVPVPFIGRIVVDNPSEPMSEQNWMIKAYNSDGYLLRITHSASSSGHLYAYANPDMKNEVVASVDFVPETCVFRIEKVEGSDGCMLLNHNRSAAWTIQVDESGRKSIFLEPLSEERRSRQTFSIHAR